MMRYFKKIVIFTVIMVFVCTGCGRYRSAYHADGFVHHIGEGSAWMEFDSFEGTYVFRLKEEKAEGDIHCQGDLASGTMTVYYDCYGRKEKLCTISGDREVDSAGGYVERGMVTIIVESDGECVDGSLKIELDSD